jgi:hypothetical protein
MKFVTLGRIGTLASALVILGASRSQAIELVTNGGFETGNLSGWTLTFSTPPTSLPSNVQVGGVSHSGAHALALGYFEGPTQFATLSQTIATTVGGTYDFSFWLKRVNQSGLTNDATSFSWNFGGLWSGSLMPPVSTFDYTLFSLSGVVATSTSTLIQFQFHEKLGYMALDDISVQTPGGNLPGTGVPDAGSTFVLLGLALLGLGASARLRFATRTA